MPVFYAYSLMYWVHSCCFLYHFPGKCVLSIRSWIKRLRRILTLKQYNVCDFDQKVMDVFPLDTLVDLGSVLMEMLFRLCFV